MKVLILAGLLVVSVLLVPSASASGRSSRNHQKRVAAPQAGVALGAAISTVVFDAITGSATLIPDIFSLVVAGIDLGFQSAGQDGSTLNTQLDTLLTDIGTLVQDAVNGNDINADINTVICDAEQIGGMTPDQCTTQTLDTVITNLVNHASNGAPAATIVTDAFAIVTSALDLAAQLAPSASTVLKGVVTLINDICQLVVDCVNVNLIKITPDVQAIINAALAL